MAVVRKTALFREIVYADAAGRTLASPITRVALCVVIRNPFARPAGGAAAATGPGDEGSGQLGTSSDLMPLINMGGELGAELIEDAVAQLGGSAISYGKVALVGTLGELEHGAAMIHPKLGAPMRAALGGSAALIPSNANVCAAGAALDLPLGPATRTKLGRLITLTR